MGGEDVGREARDLQRGGIAVLDSAGNVAWTDEAWGVDDGEGDLPRVPIGTNLLQAYRGHDDPRAHAIANGIAAIFEGKVMYFEVEHRASRESEHLFLTSVAALRGDGAGAVIIHRADVGQRVRRPRLPDVRSTGGMSYGDRVERLTARELEVLDLTAQGLDNRAIAAKLGIQYTTVRGHVRAVIEKLGARSRLEAVVRAYQLGLVSN
jgi:DNA-binding CsgD family transcriptional regulator